MMLPGSERSSELTVGCSANLDICASLLVLSVYLFVYSFLSVLQLLFIYFTHSFINLFTSLFIYSFSFFFYQPIFSVCFLCNTYVHLLGLGAGGVGVVPVQWYVSVCIVCKTIVFSLCKTQ